MNVIHIAIRSHVKLLVPRVAPLVRAPRHVDEVLDENQDGVEHEAHGHHARDADQLLHRAVGHLPQVLRVALAHPHQRRLQPPRVAEAPLAALLQESVPLSTALSDQSQVADFSIVVEFRGSLSSNGNCELFLKGTNIVSSLHLLSLTVPRICL